MFSPAASKVARLVYVMIFCRIIIKLVEKLILLLRTTCLLYCRKTGDFRDDKYKKNFVGLGSRNKVHFLLTDYLVVQGPIIYILEVT